jgi:ribonuclease HII
MRAALEALISPPEHVLIDGLPVIPFPLPQTAIIDGDCYSLSIAAASVIAKVTRDAMMRKFCQTFPEYCFSLHKGYGTELHLTKLHELGPCPIHRRSFEPVAQPFLALEGII